MFLYSFDILDSQKRPSSNSLIFKAAEIGTSQACHFILRLNWIIISFSYFQIFVSPQTLQIAQIQKKKKEKKEPSEGTALAWLESVSNYNL